MLSSEDITNSTFPHVAAIQPFAKRSVIIVGVKQNQFVGSVVDLDSKTITSRTFFSRLVNTCHHFCMYRDLVVMSTDGRTVVLGRLCLEKLEQPLDEELIPDIQVRFATGGDANLNCSSNLYLNESQIYVIEDSQLCRFDLKTVHSGPIAESAQNIAKEIVLKGDIKDCCFLKKVFFVSTDKGVTMFQKSSAKEISTFEDSNISLIAGTEKILFAAAGTSVRMFGVKAKRIVKGGSVDRPELSTARRTFSLGVFNKILMLFSVHEDRSKNENSGVAIYTSFNCNPHFIVFVSTPDKWRILGSYFDAARSEIILLGESNKSSFIKLSC